jgi:sel1 repeat protein (fragment)
MNTVLKKMMVALLALGIGQAAWADDVSNFKKMLQAAEQGNADAQFNLGVMYDNGLSKGGRTRIGRCPI